MINSNNVYLVKNRSAGRVAYSVPDLGVRRHFAPGEIQKVSYEELLRLTYQPGGKNLISSFLQIQAEDVLRELDMGVQPEYFMTEAQIKDLILNGSLDAFLDCLDYAPTGVLDLLKEYAVSLPLSDYQKREAMKEKLSFDVDKALANKKAEEEEAKNPGGFVADTTTTARPTASTRPSARRTTTNYKAEAAAATK